MKLQEYENMLKMHAPPYEGDDDDLKEVLIEVLIEEIEESTPPEFLSDVPAQRQDEYASLAVKHIQVFSAMLNVGFKIDLVKGAALKKAIKEKCWDVVSLIESRSPSPRGTAKTIGSHIIEFRSWQKANGIEPSTGYLTPVTPRKTLKETFIEAARSPDISSQWDYFICTSRVRKKPKERTALYSLLHSVGPEKLAESVCETGKTADIGWFIQEKTGKRVQAMDIRSTLIELFNDSLASSGSKRAIKKALETLEEWNRRKEKQAA